MILLKNPLFWSLLHYAEKAPFLRMDTRKDLDGIESFGHGQPNVRQAGWGFLMKLLDSHKGALRCLQVKNDISLSHVQSV